MVPYIYINVYGGCACPVSKASLDGLEREDELSTACWDLLWLDLL